MLRFAPFLPVHQNALFARARARATPLSSTAADVTSCRRHSGSQINAVAAPDSSTQPRHSVQHLAPRVVGGGREGGGGDTWQVVLSCAKCKPVFANNREQRPAKTWLVTGGGYEECNCYYSGKTIKNLTDQNQELEVRQ